jgi:hypothetical protein
VSGERDAIAELIDNAEETAAVARERQTERQLRLGFKQHPVTVMLREAAYGRKPSSEEIDALKLPEAARECVAAGVENALSVKALGRNADARRHADEVAEAVWFELPDELRDADYLKSNQEIPSDPSALAAQVRPW